MTTTPPALLAQLQSLWQSAAPPIMPPAVSPTEPAWFALVDRLAAEFAAAPSIDREPGSDDLGIAGPAGETPYHTQSEADDVDLAAGVCEWPDEMIAADLGPFAFIGCAEREYLLGRHRFAEPCGFCGGRAKHNPACVALHEDWHAKMPWGKHRGKAIADTDPRYLRWLLRSGKELETELRHEIERALEIEQGG